ncbi:MAG: OmpH family outer membrane protein [Kiritimatiellae bacterium]|nr:OmpH family outer membrane protein [Kiritimatiellia bacterium]
MKSWMMTVAVSVFCAATAFGQVTVSMVDLVRFHPSRERDRKLMKDTEKEYQSKIDKQRDRFEELRTAYERAVREARNPALAEKARQEAEAAALKQRDALAEADRELREVIRKYQDELQNLDTRLLRQVTREIRDKIGKYAKAKGYTTVLDSTTIPYADPSLDVTDDILRALGVDPKVRAEALAKEKAESDKEEAKKE